MEAIGSGGRMRLEHALAEGREHGAAPAAVVALQQVVGLGPARGRDGVEGVEVAGLVGARRIPEAAAGDGPRGGGPPPGPPPPPPGARGGPGPAGEGPRPPRAPARRAGPATVVSRAFAGT